MLPKPAGHLLLASEKVQQEKEGQGEVSHSALRMYCLNYSLSFKTDQWIIHCGHFYFQMLALRLRLKWCPKMPLALRSLWKCPPGRALSPALLCVLWFWILCWAESAPSPAQLGSPTPPVPGDWFQQAQSTKSNKLGLVSICFFQCWPSSLE